MKQYIHIIKMIPAALLLCACSDTDNLPASEEEFGPQVEEFTASMTSISAGTEVRAASTYIVNTSNDPTKTLMKDRSGWEMDVQIYKGENAYTPGEATYKYETDKWNIQNNATLRFPNYTKQKIKATFHPSSWSTSTTTAIATDQSGKEGAKILAQDILIEKEAGKSYNPAKKIEIKMKHANSMLDFIIKDVTADDIASVTVTIAGTTYTPYQAKANPIEYLLIVPTTTTTDAKSPTIKIETKAGATYQQEIKLIGAMKGNSTISNYEVNTCYCFTLNGLELILSPITITDWSTGAVEAGDYIAVTAYPTFRGTPNMTYYVYYDNCLKDDTGKAIMQEIKFNSRGECTIKPDGRIITHIGTTNELNNAKELASPVLLSDMIVDLNAAIAELSQNSTPP